MNAPRRSPYATLLLGLLLIAAGLLLPSFMPAQALDHKTLLEFAQGGLAGMGLLLVLRWFRERRDR